VAGQIETKVTASTGAAAVSGLALWSLGHYVFKGGVPDVVASWIYVLVPGALTFGAGYLARHTPRGKGEPAGNMPADIPVPVRAAKTLIPPAAAAAEQPPAVAGPAEPAAPE
jgi:hypothetical protein